MLVALNLTGIVTGKRMLGWWRGMIVGLTAFAAIATPGGEPLSMLLLAGPLAVLYFIATGFSLLNDKRRNRGNPDAELDDDEASELDLTPSRSAGWRACPRPVPPCPARRRASRTVPDRNLRAVTTTSPDLVGSGG